MKIRKQRTNFTIVSNVVLKDKTLSLKAKGLFALLFSFPDDWDYSIRGLASISKEGHDAIRSAINELENAGYLHRQSSRNENGIFTKGADYELYNEPTNPLDYPVSENPTTVNPTKENSTQYNKEELKKEESNKDISIESAKHKKIEESAIAKIYKAYPPKCPIKDVSLKASKKNKEAIKKILKSGTFTEEELLGIIERYKFECKKSNTFMKHFGTFLNNIPDYSEIEIKEEYDLKYPDYGIDSDKYFLNFNTDHLDLWSVTEKEMSEMARDGKLKKLKVT